MHTVDSAALARGLRARKLARAAMLSAALAALLPGTARADAVKPDILGIRLGMTPQEVAGVLHKEFPAAPIKQDNEIIAGLPETKFIAAMHVSMSGPGRQTEITARFSAPPNEIRAIYVERKTLMLHEEAPLVGALVDDLVKKYGQAYSEVGMAAGQSPELSWMWDGAGHRLSRPASATGCQNFLSSVQYYSGDESAFRNPRMFANPVQRGCIVGVLVTIPSPANRIANAFRTVAVDFEESYAGGNKTAAYVHQLQQAILQKQQQRAKANAPRL